jgi:aminoglycoside phosphotransferase (APT) family kinase protein
MKDQNPIDERSVTRDLETGATPAEAERLLRQADERFAAVEVASVAASTANYVYRTSNGHILRFPHNTWVAERFWSERRVLEGLAGKLDAEIPKIAHFNETPLFMCYPEIPGTVASKDVVADFDPDQRAAFTEGIARFLVQLHGQPVATFGSLGSDYGDRFIASLRENWVELAGRDRSGRAGGLLDAALEEWDRFAPEGADPVLLHQDLHGQNLICDPASGALRGVLDFTLAWIGDPHWEFPEIFRCGEDILEAVLESYEAGSGRAIDRDKVKTLSSLQLCRSLMISKPGGERERVVLERIAGVAG